MGRNLQGPDDHCSGNRSAGASLSHRRVEHPQLPHGSGQEESGSCTRCWRIRSEIFKDPMTTVAAIDRLVHHSVIVELNIPSYRMEAAKKNRDPAADAGETNNVTAGEVG